MQNDELSAAHAYLKLHTSCKRDSSATFAEELNATSEGMTALRTSSVPQDDKQSFQFERVDPERADCILSRDRCE